ncbi:N/A [soil metagenome]
MDTKTKLWYFENFNLFESLSAKEKAQLTQLAHEWHTSKNEAVFRQGQTANMVYLLKAGKVKVSNFTSDGREIIHAIIQPGELFGERALTGEPNCDTAAFTLEPSFLCAVPLEIFQGVLNANSTFTLSITKLIGLRLRKVESQLTSLLFKSAPERIKGFIRDLADEHGRKIGSEVEVKLHLKHGEIGKLTATSRQTVSSVFNELEKENIILYDRRRILIRRYDAL